MTEFLRTYRKNVVAVVILVLVLVVLFIVETFTKKEDPKKEMQNHDYVYTLESMQTKESNRKSELPQINLKSDSVRKQNAEIMKLYYNTVNGKKNSFTYKYTVYDNLLFLLIEIHYYEPLNAGTETRYISYINDLDTKELVMNEDVLQKLGYEADAIEKSITNKMKSYYDKASSEGLIAWQECDFSCYMLWKDMTQVEEGASLFVEDNHLVVYRGFSLKSDRKSVV